MREKFANSAWFFGSSPLVHSWFRILMMSVFLGILIVWGIDGLNTGSFQSDYLVLKLNSTQTLPFKDFSFRNLSVDIMEDREKIDLNLTNQILAKSDGNPHLESSSQPLNLVENETHIVSSWSPYVLENATKIGNERNTSSPRILGDTLKLGESSRLYRLDWVPISFAYNINDSFVPQMDSLDSVEEETEGTTDQIVPAVTELLVAQFMWLDYDGPTKPIYLYINSSGTQNEKRETVGSETEAYAIADTMAYCKADVYTVNCGMAYGQAAMLLSLGAKGFRGLQPNCSTFSPGVLQLRIPFRLYHSRNTNNNFIGNSLCANAKPTMCF